MEDAPHFRRGGRRPVALKVRFRAGSALEHSGTTTDLGMGGAFIETFRPPLPGAHVVLILTTPTAWDPLEIECEVRWSHDGRDGRIMGFGVRFDALSEVQASALYELLQATGFGSDR